MSIYGNTGEDLRKQLADQIKQFFHDDEKKYDIEVPLNIIDNSNRINYLELEKFVELLRLANKKLDEVQ